MPHTKIHYLNNFSFRKLLLLNSFHYLNSYLTRKFNSLKRLLKVIFFFKYLIFSNQFHFKIDNTDFDVKYYSKIIFQYDVNRIQVKDLIFEMAYNFRFLTEWQLWDTTLCFSNFLSIAQTIKTSIFSNNYLNSI